MATLISDEIHFKLSKCAPQAAYVKLDEATFLQNLKTGWENIRRNEVAAWETSGDTPIDVFEFEVYAYAHRERYVSHGASIRRATTSGVNEALPLCREYARTHGAQLHEIAAHHAAAA